MKKKKRPEAIFFGFGDTKKLAGLPIKTRIIAPNGCGMPITGLKKPTRMVTSKCPVAAKRLLRSTRNNGTRQTTYLQPSPTGMATKIPFATSGQKGVNNLN